MPNLEQFWFEVLHTVLKMADSCSGQHPRHENLLPPSSLSNLLRVSKKDFKALFSLQLENFQLSIVET